jgi:hypothetical protein
MMDDNMEIYIIVYKNLNDIVYILRKLDMFFQMLDLYTGLWLYGNSF